MKSDLEVIRKQVPALTSDEEEIAKARLASGIAIHMIVGELSVRREEQRADEETRERDRRVDELIRALNDEGLLTEIYDDEYASAVVQVREGAPINAVVCEVQKNAQARKQAKIHRQTKGPENL